MVRLSEVYFQDDPNTCQIKLRQFAEALAQLSASRFGLQINAIDTLADVLRRLGHANHQSTARYAHLDDEHLIDVAQQIGNAVARLMAVG